MTQFSHLESAKIVMEATTRGALYVVILHRFSCSLEQLKNKFSIGTMKAIEAHQEPVLQVEYSKMVDMCSRGAVNTILIVTYIYIFICI